MAVIPSGYKAILRDAFYVFVIPEKEDQDANPMVETRKWNAITGELSSSAPLQVWFKFITNGELEAYSGDGSDIKTTLD